MPDDSDSDSEESELDIHVSNLPEEAGVEIELGEMQHDLDDDEDE